MAIPISIERIAPLSPIAVEILNRVPALSNSADSDLHALFQDHEKLLAEIVVTANRRGLAVDSIEPIPATDLAEMALSLLVRQYMQRAFDVSEDRRYWRYTLACAFTCQELIGFDSVTGLRAYAAGLLHDIGRLALIAAYPDKYANLLTLTNSTFESGRPFNVSEYERLLFGLDRFATGNWLATTWKLPAWLQPVVGKFNDRPAPADRQLIEIVRAGTQLAHSLGFGYLEAAPRISVREILSKLPSALHHWKNLDQWNLGEEGWRARIEPRLGWY
ncbi:MAG TPA: HDOD domain-containing protein [Bryobacteraceae bacterium]|nr:HDOD domain-containing protein [Bryobacteraceae bacterium]